MSVPKHRRCTHDDYEVAGPCPNERAPGWTICQAHVDVEIYRSPGVQRSESPLVDIPEGLLLCALPYGHAGDHSFYPADHEPQGPVRRPEDAVYHPEHYGGDTPYETIKCLEAWGLTNNAYRFNAIKYLSRADKKGDTIEDLRKAIWYIEREIKARTKDDVRGRD